MKNTFSSLLILFLSVAVTLAASGNEINKNFHKSFDVRKGCRLCLEHGDGDVTITPWDKDVVDVKVHYRVEYKSFGLTGKHDFDVEFSESDDTIYVIGHEKSHVSIGYHSFKQYEYTYTIFAPGYLVLDIRGEDGNVDIENRNGNIECNIEDGNLNLKNISSAKTRIELEDGKLQINNMKSELRLNVDDGNIVINESKIPKCRIKLNDGNLRIKRTHGNFDISIDDGDIFLDHVKTSRLFITSADGNIDCNLLKTANLDVDIKTDDGDVNLDIEKGTSASFSIKTDDGRIGIDLPDSKNFSKKHNRVSGEIYGGDGRIRINTNDGNVTLREFR